MRNKATGREGAYFGKPSLRAIRFRDRINKSELHISTERAKLITAAYQMYEADPMVIKRAKSFAYILDQMTLTVYPEDMFLGYQCEELYAAPIFPEYSMDWVIRELDEFDKRPTEAYYLREDQKEDLRSIAGFWKNRTLEDRALALFPEDTLEINRTGIISALSSITCGDGHIAVDLEKVLCVGLKGIKREAKEAMEKLDLTEYTGMKSRNFLRAVGITMDAAAHFCERNAAYAESMAEKEEAERAGELRKMAEICRRVPENPAKSFREAIQSIWTVMLLLQIESNGHSFSLGRLDQLLYPYYQRDIENGVLTEDEACELLEVFWVKLFSVNKIRPWAYTKYAPGNPMYENITIGGQTQDGQDAVNAVSHLILRAVAHMHLTQPNLTVRYHKGLSSEFLQECIMLIREGIGMPAFNNDEIIIPGLQDIGVTLEDAREYACIGCVELAVPGKWGYRCAGMSYINFARVFNMVLRGGLDDVSGKKLFDCKSLGEYENYEELFAAWEEATRWITKHSIITDTIVDLGTEENVPDAFCSALVNDCIQRGKLIKEGGAVYDSVSGLQIGVINVGNSLAAIKQNVFEDATITQEQLMEALSDNFEKLENQKIRKVLLQTPKYGCDCTETDEIVAKAYNVYLKDIEQYHNNRYGRGPIGGGYFGCTSSISANVPSGAAVSATPDGRQAWQPLAEGISPSAGTDTCGPTAVLLSAGRLPNRKVLGGNLLNQKILPSCLEARSDRLKMEQMLRTFFDDLKGFHIQYNYVDRATLVDAKVHPKDHENLIVRVAGYSAFFTCLCPETQDDIIARTEHVL